jgi:hypothetical protein
MDDRELQMERDKSRPHHGFSEIDKKVTYQTPGNDLKIIMIRSRSHSHSMLKLFA